MRTLLAAAAVALTVTSIANSAPSVNVRAPQYQLPGQFGALIRFHSAVNQCAQSVTASVKDVEKGGKGLAIYGEPLLISGDLLGAVPWSVTYSLVSGPAWAPVSIRAGEWVKLDFHGAATWTLRYSVSGCPPTAAPIALKIKVSG